MRNTPICNEVLPMNVPPVPARSKAPSPAPPVPPRQAAPGAGGEHRAAPVLPPQHLSGGALQPVRRSPPVPSRQGQPSPTQQQQAPARDLCKFCSFGPRLEDMMAAQNRAWPGEPLPRVLCTLVRLVETNGGLRSEGIFRLSGNAAEVSRLRSQLDKGAFDVVFAGDPNTPAHLLKQWVGELPEPLVPRRVAEHVLQGVRDGLSPAQTAAAASAALPALHQAVLRELLALMRRVLQHSDENRMTTATLALVWSPNVFGRDSDGGNPLAFMQNTQLQTKWMQAMILSDF